MKRLALVLSAAVLAGCSDLLGSNTPEFVRVGACSGPAFSLPDSLRSQRLPHLGHYIPDDDWAEIARTLPGGFAGRFIEGREMVVQFTRPADALAAQAAFEAKGYPLNGLTIRTARWDFAQLVDWSDYIMPKIGGMAVLADNDELHNRVRLAAESKAKRQALVDSLAKLSLPCDLVIVSIQSGKAIAN